MAQQNYSDQFMADRIGITMRVGQAAGSGESRDCLAQDWARYMAALAPDVAWVPIPNLGAAVAEFIQHWQLDGFILSGGNDLGTCPIRDKTENTVIDHAVRNALPVFGVCRGMQLLQQRGGGALRRCEPKTHLAQKHTVHLRTDLLEFDAPDAPRLIHFTTGLCPQTPSPPHSNCWPQARMAAWRPCATAPRPSPPCNGIPNAMGITCRRNWTRTCCAPL